MGSSGSKKISNNVDFPPEIYRSLGYKYSDSVFTGVKNTEIFLQDISGYVRVLAKSYPSNNKISDFSSKIGGKIREYLSNLNKILQLYKFTNDDFHNQIVQILSNTSNRIQNDFRKISKLYNLFDNETKKRLIESKNPLAVLSGNYRIEASEYRLLKKDIARNRESFILYSQKLEKYLSFDRNSLNIMLLNFRREIVSDLELLSGMFPEGHQKARLVEFIRGKLSNITDNPAEYNLDSEIMGYLSRTKGKTGGELYSADNFAGMLPYILIALLVIIIIMLINNYKYIVGIRPGNADNTASRSPE